MDTTNYYIITSKFGIMTLDKDFETIKYCDQNAWTYPSNNYPTEHVLFTKNRKTMVLDKNGNVSAQINAQNAQSFNNKFYAARGKSLWIMDEKTVMLH